MTQHMDAERGDRAKRLLDSELMQEAFTKLEAAYADAWARTKPEDREAREHQYRLMLALRQVRGHIETVAANGSLARAQLREIEGKRGWL